MTFLKRFVSLILSCSLCGCIVGVQVPGICGEETRIINPDDSNIPRRSLEQAADWWNSASGKELVVVSSFLEGNVTLVEVPQLPERYPGALGLAYNRQTDDGSFDSCSIVMLAGRWDLPMIKHELGHCLGLGHDDPIEFPNSVMNKVVDCWPACIAYPHQLEALPECSLDIEFAL